MKYAPPDSKGNKPWVRTTTEFGRSYSSIVYTPDRAAAQHAFRKGVYETVQVRRATPFDVDRLHIESVYGPES